MVNANRKVKLLENLSKLGYLKSLKAKKAMMKVPRELFVPKEFYQDAYSDTPIPIPGDQTISAPHIHALNLSELNLKPGEKFLEIGSGSGIMLAYASELIGKKGKVVGIEINKQAYNFAKSNLKLSGYKDVILIHGDGSLGYPKYAPYDKILVSAASPDIPTEIIDQLKPNGILLIVVGPPFGNQILYKIKKSKSGKIEEKELLPVAFVPLKGKYGWE